jgi:hypothetical protein
LPRHQRAVGDLLAGAASIVLRSRACWLMAPARSLSPVTTTPPEPICTTASKRFAGAISMSLLVPLLEFNQDVVLTAPPLVAASFLLYPQKRIGLLSVRGVPHIDILRTDTIFPMANTVISGDIIDQKRKEKCFDVALQTRNFEIDLFWKRSLFFWGFIAAAFTAYSLVSKSHPNLCIVIACFDTVCLLAWTFLNRSSKFWQEVWENEVKAVQCDVVGKDIFREPDINASKGFWGSAPSCPASVDTIF